jgi:sec-independent protein translocase protein TatB
MFNFGWGEIVLIGIVALIAIGPKELPTVLRTIGQLMGKVRRMANEFQGQFQEALREADIADLKKHADDVTSSLNETVTDFTKYDPLAETQKDIEKSLTLDDPAKPAELPAPDTQGAAKPKSSETLPQIDVPLPDAPAAVTEKDFAAAEPKSEAKPAEKPKKKTAAKTTAKKAPKKSASRAGSQS